MLYLVVACGNSLHNSRVKFSIQHCTRHCTNLVLKPWNVVSAAVR